MLDIKKPHEVMGGSGRDKKYLDFYFRNITDFD